MAPYIHWAGLVYLKFGIFSYCQTSAIRRSTCTRYPKLLCIHITKARFVKFFNECDSNWSECISTISVYCSYEEYALHMHTPSGLTWIHTCTCVIWCMYKHVMLLQKSNVKVCSSGSYTSYVALLSTKDFNNHLVITQHFSSPQTTNNSGFMQMIHR